MVELVSWPMWLLGLIFLFVSVTIGVGGLLLVRRFLPNRVLAKEHGFVGSITEVIGTMFAVLLAFLVVVVWQDHREQSQRTVEEACRLGNIYRDSRAFPEKEMVILQALVRSYTVALVTDAWPSMTQGREGTVAWSEFNRLYAQVVSLEPANSKEQVVYANLLEHVNELANFRRLRLLSCREPVVPAALWLVMMMAGFISVSASYFFPIQSLRVHGIMIGFLSAIIGLTIFLGCAAQLSVPKSNTPGSAERSGLACAGCGSSAGCTPRRRRRGSRGRPGGWRRARGRSARCRPR